MKISCKCHLSSSLCKTRKNYICIVTIITIFWMPFYDWWHTLIFTVLQIQIHPDPKYYNYFTQIQTYTAWVRVYVYSTILNNHLIPRAFLLILETLLYCLNKDFLLDGLCIIHIPCVFGHLLVFMGAEGFVGGVKGWRRARPPKAWNANCWLVKTGSPVFLGRNSWADCCTRRIGAELQHVLNSFYGHFLESPLLKKGLSHHLCTPPFTESYL